MELAHIPKRLCLLPWGNRGGLVWRVFPACLWLVSASPQAATFDETLSQGETYRERGQIHLALDTLEPLQSQAGTPEQAEIGRASCRERV